MFGRYRVERELARGASSVVYRGTDTQNGRVVAIKAVAMPREPASGASGEVKQRFLREAEIVGRLRHPHIVTIYDAGEEHGFAYIAMEFLKGGNLTPHITPDNLLPLSQVLGIVSCVAAALSYAHANNVVHRDIKPANIMYEPGSGTVKVTDFGLAHVIGASRPSGDAVFGTPSYLSPEQLAGADIDGRSDLFSLGVVFYQLACGHLAFQAESMAQLMFKIACEPHTDIRTYSPWLPLCLVDIVNKLLAKRREERFQSGDELAQEIEVCVASGGGAPKQDVIDIKR